MCNHFQVKNKKISELKKRFGLKKFSLPKEFSESIDQDFYPSRGAKHNMAPIIFLDGEEKHLSLFRWDLIPHWWDKPLSEKTFSSYNAHIETLEEKATYRDAWANRNRCLIPASSFFEWPDKDAKLPKEERYERNIYPPKESLFSFGGLWTEFPNSEGEIIRSFSIITLPANATMLSIPHNRMPLIVPKESENNWLNPRKTITTKTILSSENANNPSIKVRDKPDHGQEMLLF